MAARYLLRTADQAGESDLREILNVCRNQTFYQSLTNDIDRSPKVNSSAQKPTAAGFQSGSLQTKTCIARL